MRRRATGLESHRKGCYIEGCGLSDRERLLRIVA